MKLIIRYIFFIFIGILIYILLNRYEKFNISALPWIYFNLPSHTLINNPDDLNTPNATEGTANDSGYYQELQQPIDSRNLYNQNRIIGFLINSEESKNKSLEFVDQGDIEPYCSDPNDTSDCYYRKINSSDSNNSEFDINLVSQAAISGQSSIMEDEITGEQLTKFDLHLEDNLSQPEYKLFITDNLSLLKIYSLLNKFYIEHNDTPASNIPQPILYFSCHAQFLNTPPLSIPNLNYVDRDLKYHVVDEDGDVKKGCSVQTIVDLTDLDHGFQESNPKTNIQSGSIKYYSRYQIPLHFKNDEFVEPENNAILNCNVCYMVILYQNEEDGDYYQYGSSVLNNISDKNKNLNLMSLFSMITKYTYEDEFGEEVSKKVPILFKSYNTLLDPRNYTKFPKYTYYDVNELWNEITNKLLEFEDSYKVTDCYERSNRWDTTPPVTANNSNYPLNLFLDACVKANKDRNMTRNCTFTDIIQKIRESGVECERGTDYNPIWDQHTVTERNENSCLTFPTRRREEDDDNPPKRPRRDEFGNECASSGLEGIAGS